MEGATTSTGGAHLAGAFAPPESAGSYLSCVILFSFCLLFFSFPPAIGVVLQALLLPHGIDLPDGRNGSDDIRKTRGCRGRTKDSRVLVEERREGLPADRHPIHHIEHGDPRARVRVALLQFPDQRAVQFARQQRKRG